MHNNNTNEMMRIPEITTEELRTAINKLKKRKSPDNKGIRAEDIKACHDETRNMVRQICNEIIKQDEFTPEAWKKVRKSDTQKWRCGRCQKLPPDLLVASGVQTVHDNTVQQTISATRPITSGRSGGIQKIIPDNRSYHEWGIKMWTPTIDFTKAFDSITQINLERPQILRYGTRLHQPPEEAIQRPESITTDVESNMFEIKKGTKQGDPLSSLLSNMVLQRAQDDDIPRWQKKESMGIYLSDNDHDCLTDMRFADDELLFASSNEQLRKMLREFKRSTGKLGLRNHPGKTKILSNQSANTRKETEVHNIKIEILTRGESAKYLGQMITFQQQETTEIRNRIGAAWATFHKYRQELTSKNYLLKHRLRLFDAVITPTICYASGTWTPTKEHERMIQSTQRKMFRLIIQTK